jgi:hypothetical protein
MPKDTAKIPFEPGGTLLELIRSVMFAFTPPATPEPTPTPCPHCQHPEGIAMYATAVTEYFRCVRCRQIWTLTHDAIDRAPTPAAA